jgi:hypothetical protein
MPRSIFEQDSDYGVSKASGQQGQVDSLQEGAYQA